MSADCSRCRKLLWCILDARHFYASFCFLLSPCLALFLYIGFSYLF